MFIKLIAEMIEHGQVRIVLLFLGRKIFWPMRLARGLRSWHWSSLKVCIVEALMIDKVVLVFSLEGDGGGGSVFAQIWMGELIVSNASVMAGT